MAYLIIILLIQAIHHKKWARNAKKFAFYPVKIAKFNKIGKIFHHFGVAKADIMETRDITGQFMVKIQDLQDPLRNFLSVI